MHSNPDTERDRNFFRVISEMIAFTGWFVARSICPMSATFPLPSFAYSRRISIAGDNYMLHSFYFSLAFHDASDRILHTEHSTCTEKLFIRFSHELRELGTTHSPRDSITFPIRTKAHFFIRHDGRWTTNDGHEMLMEFVVMHRMRVSSVQV